MLPRFVSRDEAFFDGSRHMYRYLLVGYEVWRFAGGREAVWGENEGR